jgi:glycosyltransferase involved in cell wall biosynthesis
LTENSLSNLGARTNRRLIRVLSAYVGRLLNIPQRVESTDIIYSSSHFLYDFIPALFVRLRHRNAKLVVFVHGMIPEPKKRSYTRSPIGNLFSFIAQSVSLILIKRFADLVFTVNHMVRDELIKSGFLPKKVMVIGNGLDYQTIDSTPSPGKKYDGIYVGAIHPAKGIFDAVDVWHMVCSEMPGAKLAIVGSGYSTWVDSFKRMIESRHLEKNVDMLGYRHQGEELYSVIKSARVAIFPSREETWGISVAEAAACGLAVLAYDLEIYREVFGDVIVLVPIYRTDIMAKEALCLIRDEEQARSLGLRAKSFVQRYSWDNIAERESSEMLMTLSNRTPIKSELT